MHFPADAVPEPHCAQHGGKAGPELHLLAAYVWDGREGWERQRAALQCTQET